MINDQFWQVWEANFQKWVDKIIYSVFAFYLFSLFSFFYFTEFLLLE